MNRANGWICRGWQGRSWLGIGSLALALLMVGPAKAQNFETALAAAADAIAEAVVQSGKQRVAVIDFDQIEGPVTALGRFLAEEVSANLAERRRGFAVIDRANLQSILAENALSMSGLVNPENAKRLGQIAGVDALILGTYTDFGETYRLSLKAITTDTAEMVASARTNLPKTNALVQLAERVVEQRGPMPSTPGAAEPGPQPASPPTTQAAAPDVLYETGVGKGGFEGWSLSPDWKRLNDTLLSDGTLQAKQFAPSVPPHKPVSADYAIETEIRVIQEGSDNRDSFGVIVRATDQGGYAVGVGNKGATRICYLSAWEGMGYVGGGKAFRDDKRCKPVGQAFKAGTDWHTYRVEVKGNEITLFIDDSVVTGTIDNTFLSAGRVGLWSNGYQLEVRKFKVMSIEQQAAAPPSAVNGISRATMEDLPRSLTGRQHDGVPQLRRRPADFRSRAAVLAELERTVIDRGLAQE